MRYSAQVYAEFKKFQRVFSAIDLVDRVPPR